MPDLPATTLTRYRPYRPRAPLERRGASPALTRTIEDSASASDFTVGIEEELFLVDARTLACVERMPDAFHAEAKELLGEQMKREVLASMVETITRPHASMSSLAAELVDLRMRLAAVASRHGLSLLASGTHPFADWRDQRITEKARYDRVAEHLAALCKRVHVCGMHVHVALPDPAMRICVMNRAQQYLPLLLALSTSSPFWRGASTGLKSYRSAAYDESPRTGFPIRFADAAEFERYVAKLTRAGFIPDQSYLWWAIRPSLKYPTLELRIADSCTDWRDAIAIATLYRCLVHRLVSDPDMGAAWESHHFLINQENRWQAIRYGLDARVLDPVRDRASSVRESIASLVAALSPSAEALGCTNELAFVGHILDGGTSAERQASIFTSALCAGAEENEAVRSVAADIALLTLAA